MNCQRIERHDVQMLGWGRRGVLQEMNIVVQSGLISQKKESNSFMCPSSYPGHLCWAQKACGDFTSYGILEGGEGRKKSALYSYGSGRTRSKGSHLINRTKHTESAKPQVGKDAVCWDALGSWPCGVCCPTLAQRVGRSKSCFPRL